MGTGEQYRNDTGRVFKVLDGKTCIGVPYTKNIPESCNGWEGLNAEECELKLGLLQFSELRAP